MTRYGRRFFNFADPVWSSRAPGRLDVMGGIADYSGALVLQLPLDRTTDAQLQRQRSARCDIISQRSGTSSSFGMELTEIVNRDPGELARWFAEHPEDHWAAYVVGVVQYCLQRAPEIDAERPGMKLHLGSFVPEGKGVSSSAALEVATMMAVAASYGLEISPQEVAVACQWVENHIVGAPCGIMDQMTSACGQRGRLLRLRCQPGTIEGYVDIPEGYRFYGIDSGVRHAVTGSDYGTVRAAAFMGYRMIAEMADLTVEYKGDCIVIRDPEWRGYLANISPAEFEQRFKARLPEQMRGDEFLAKYRGTTDKVTRVDASRMYPVRQATAHPIYEQMRVERFATLLGELAARPSAANELGMLMYASHASYSACGLGSDATDRLVAMVNEAGAKCGLFGAKITGGGSGGTVAVLGTIDAEAIVRQIAERYSEETGRETDLFVESGPGAAEFGVRWAQGLPRL
jgi:galactokinase